MTPLPPPVPVAQLPRTSALAVWSLILGLLGLFLCFPVLGALICGILALVKIKESGGALRGNGMAIAGLVMSVFALPFFAVVASLVIPIISMSKQKEQEATMTLAEARQGFVTKVNGEADDRFAPTLPPRGTLRLVSYRSPVGELAAYLSPIAEGPEKKPAIIWVVGGFSNSISEVAWDEAPPENDQSARVFRERGVVTMYPSLRGGNENPGHRETFFGEVDDVLAAADFLAQQPGIDPQRIYLGGHSTGGTLALLVAESSTRFRAIFAFGPVARAADYGKEFMTFDVTGHNEKRLREPIRWLRAIRTPTYVLEGEKGNIESFHELAKAAPKGSPLSFHPVPGHDHFSPLRPISEQIATQILTDTGPVPKFEFQQPPPRK